MDWIYSWKDSIFYGMCSCSGTQAYHEKEQPHHHDRLEMPLQLKAYRLVYFKGVGVFAKNLALVLAILHIFYYGSAYYGIIETYFGDLG
ncbi:hypothetical protein CRE_17852 [Caenorhabditis remanei]|uniref:Uncharacterized protein n=1 Tax=Caenorhabditis remanei TaxID=31234 RepID=E3MDP3_CAERE|nr:hypothetical protein CRE_17852 [Caenorhabditis remanei]